MAYDFNGGLSTIALKKPVKPSKVQAPDAKNLFLHYGENKGQYLTFIEAVSDLAQAFKFLPAEDQAKYQQGIGRAYSNLEFSPDANDWDLLDGISPENSQSFYQIAKSGISGYSDQQAFGLMCSMLESKERVFSILHDIFGDSSNLTNDSAVIDNISSWLDQYTEVDPHNLGVLKMFFGMQTDFINTLDAYVNCQTYWGEDLTNPNISGDLGSFSYTLSTKVESYIYGPNSTLTTEAEKTAAEALKARWFDTSCRYDKVGDALTADLTPAKKVLDCQLTFNAAQAAYNSCAQTVYDKALAAYNKAVAANADQQTLDALNDALNTADANRTDTSPDEQETLLANLQDAKNALKDAKTIYADFETNTSGSWVEFFCDRMDKYSADEVIRVIIGHMMNRSADQKYRNEKAEYQDKKEDLIMDEIFTLRMQAKAIAESKKTFKKLVARSSKVSVAIKARAKAPAVSGRARPTARAAARPAVRSSAGPAVRAAVRPAMRSVSGTTPKHLAAGGAAKRAPSRIAGGQGVKSPVAAVGARAVAPIRPKAASPALKPQAQAPKHNKDEKKVI